MVFFHDGADCSVAAPGPRCKPGPVQSKHKDPRSRKTIVKQPSSVGLNLAIEKALVETGTKCSAWALTILPDVSRDALYYSSSNIDRHKTLLFRDDGWKHVQDAASRAAAAHQIADRRRATSPVAPVTVHADSDVNDEPMSIAASDSDLDNCQPAKPSPAKSRALRLPPKPRRDRNSGDRAPDLIPRKRRHSSTATFKESAIEAAPPSASTKRSFPAAGDLRFQIGDSEYVEFALRRLLDQLQQIALKALETEWIKVAEPKKQTNFPYTKKTPGSNEQKRLCVKGRIPSWWPIEKSPYIEPHHNKKSGRTEVALALLRLRRGNDWIDRLEAASKHIRLYFSQNKDDDFELKREARRNEIVRCIFNIARYEEDLSHGGVDPEFEVTAFDIPPLRRQRNRKQSTMNALQLSESTSRATSASPGSVTSPSELVSPANNLSLRDDLGSHVRSPASQMDPPQRIISASTSISQAGMTEMPLLNRAAHSTQQDHQPYIETHMHRAMPQNLQRSQVPSRHSYDYNAKLPPSAYDDVHVDYSLSRGQHYDIATTPTPYVGWQPSSELESYGVSASFPPRQPSSYQAAESAFPGRSEFSFQSQDLMTSTAPYQDPLTAASPMSMGPPVMARRYSHAPTHSFQTPRSTLAIGAPSLFHEGHYRHDSGNAISEMSPYPMTTGNHQFN